MATVSPRSPAPLPTVHDAWECGWEDCETNGKLDQRGAYFRHVCYGHGRERDTKREPTIYYLCVKHANKFNVAHGLDNEPDWVARARMQADHRRGTEGAHR